MTEKMKDRLWVFAPFAGLGVIAAGLLYLITADFYGVLFIFIFFECFYALFILLLGSIPNRFGPNIPVENYLSDEPIDTRDESDIFDEALGLKQPEEREKTFDELIAKKPKDIPQQVRNDSKPKASR